MSHPTTDSGTHHRRLCRFHGRVQGVGFRYTAQNIAIRHNVTGYVRNLPDGSVELLMEGPDEEADQVVSNLQEKMSCYIRQIDMSLMPATGEFDRFFIRH
ncbi:MAG TPA: acylphosphatase [Tepidisphaeraceae bacterium]|nr:acylphosphatase [Tepidisphaeraceae bacterium]